MKMVNKAAHVAGLIGDIKRVCVRSFFNGVASRRHIRRRRLTVTAAAMCAAFVISAALINARVSLAVYFNGEEVGAASSIAEVPKIVASAESQLTELFGYDYSLDGALSLSAEVGHGAESVDIEKAIILSVDGVEELYAVTVGGEVVAAAEDDNVLYGVLQEILAEYTTENTESVRFLEDVTISRGFVTEDTMCGAEELRALLDPESGARPLTVQSVETAERGEEIPFETVFIDDETLYEGDSRVDIEGAPGSVLITENVVLINGTETSRNDGESVIIKEPVSEVVARGTMPRPKTASYGEYIWPTEGVITSSFGYRATSVGSRDHKGLDIAGFKGQEIYAADGGEVTFAGNSGGYGYVVFLMHDNGEETVYAHCSKLLVSEGDQVYRGQLIAQMGRSGVASGVHCHFEVRVDGKPIDPLTRLGTDKR